MYCPKCKAEYREGFTECADCEISLVPELPGLGSKEEQAFLDLEEVLSTANPGEIALIKSLLEAENIPYLTQGENFSAIQVSIPVRFMIPRDHIDRAREILENFL
jgi:hypothetical protein